MQKTVNTALAPRFVMPGEYRRSVTRGGPVTVLNLLALPDNETFVALKDSEHSIHAVTSRELCINCWSVGAMA